MYALWGQVNWLEEEPCFRGVAVALANFYSLLPLLPDVPEIAEGDEEAQRKADAEDELHRRSPQSIHYMAQYAATSSLPMPTACSSLSRRHLLFPAIRHYLTTPKSLARDNDVIQVCALHVPCCCDCADAWCYGAGRMYATVVQDFRAMLTMLPQLTQTLFVHISVHCSLLTAH